MKIFGTLLLMLSTIWSLAVGLHTFASLLPGGSHLSPSLRWFQRLPLPNEPMHPSADWPMLFGVTGMMAGVLLVGLAKRAERMKGEQSEA